LFRPSCGPVPMRASRDPFTLRSVLTHFLMGHDSAPLLLVAFCLRQSGFSHFEAGQDPFSLWPIRLIFAWVRTRPCCLWSSQDPVFLGGQILVSLKAGQDPGELGSRLSPAVFGTSQDPGSHGSGLDPAPLVQPLSCFL
jgi:hypothetical protein